MNISRKQLSALFICSVIPWTVGNGLIPLLPVYATEIGADAAVAGYYLAFSFLAIALGALAAGWVSGKVAHLKRALLATTVTTIPTAWLMGQVHSVWGLAAVTAALWFFGGMIFVLLTILAGRSASKGERGWVYGLLGLTSGLGALIGGLGIGWLVERWGYTSMFNILAAYMAIGPASALFIEDKIIPPSSPENAPAQTLPGLSKNFYLLFTAGIIISTATSLVLLVRSIVMDHLEFDPLAISSTGAIGGLVAMPFPFLMGWLSDRIGRKTLLIGGYLTALVALVWLAYSKQLWHFWLAIGINGIAVGSSSIGNALVNDLVPAQAMGKALSLFGAAAWIGGILGFAAAGVTLQNLGVVPTYIIGGCLVIAAVALLIPIQSGARKIQQPDPPLHSAQ